MKNHGMNPYLPSWEYVPDGEPHVFGKRVYIYGSHDRFAGYAFCQNDYVCWSAPVDDLTDWQYEGIIYTRAEAAHNEDGRQCLYGVGVMAYTLSKRAMNYYTSLKAVELGKRGIRVNALLPGSTDTGMKKEFEKMAGGQDNLVKENGGAGRLATPQEMADPLLFLNSDMAAFVSGLLLIADMGHNCEKTLGFCKNQLDVPAALKLYNTKFFQNKLKTNQ